CDATDLVPGDTNGFADVFVRDRQTGTTERISVASGGTQANNYSGPGDHLAISSDGRFVAFSSRATNLVTSDLNGSQDVFVRDRVIGVTERVSVASDNTAANDWSGGPAISDDGRFVAFGSGATNLVVGDTNEGLGGCEGLDTFVRDRLMGVTERVSVASDGSQGILPTTTTTTSTTLPTCHNITELAPDGGLVLGTTGTSFD